MQFIGEEPPQSNLRVVSQNKLINLSELDGLMRVQRNATTVDSLDTSIVSTSLKLNKISQ